MKNERVIDPMMGEGTTGIDPLQLERRFIGIEKDKDTLNKALNNIKKVIGKSRSAAQ